jgi:hypothetical protein
MGYKFFGKPFQEIKSKLTGKVAFRFDSKGEFITDDTEIISRATGYFDHVPVKIEVVGERVAKTFIVPPLTITTNDQGEEAGDDAQVPGFKCSECDFVAKNKFGLLAHMRKHKEG